MNGTVFIIPGILAVLMVIMAIFLLNGKGAFLIAGYNTMTRDEKAKYDKNALCRFVGWLLIISASCMLLVPAAIYLEIVWLTYCGTAIILVITIGAAIYANTGNRFRKNDNSEVSVDTGNDNSKSMIIKVVMIFTGVILIAVGILLYQGGKDPVVNVFDNSIQIKAMYGLSIDFSDIADISLMEKSMSDIGIGNSNRMNGYGGIGESLKGHFKSDNLGEVLLFVQSKSSPTIRIKRHNNNDIYINFRDNKKTEQLYYKMISVQQTQ